MLETEFESWEDVEKRQKTGYLIFMISNLEDPYLKARMLSRLIDLYENRLDDRMRQFIEEQASQVREPLRKMIDSKKAELTSQNINRHDHSQFQ